MRAKGRATADVDCAILFLSFPPLETESGTCEGDSFVTILLFDDTEACAFENEVRLSCTDLGFSGETARATRAGGGTVEVCVNPSALCDEGFCI